MVLKVARKGENECCPVISRHIVSAFLVTSKGTPGLQCTMVCTHTRVLNLVRRTGSSYIGNSAIGILIWYPVPRYTAVFPLDVLFIAINITVRRLRFINPRSSYLMKYAPPEDKRQTVLGCKTHARNEYVNHYLRKRKEQVFRLEGATS